MLTGGSLFSGIGGLDLGLERAGIQILWQSEIDPYASGVLRRHWGRVPNLGDVRVVRAFPAVDVVFGGFPCQPTSVAGKGRGREDERWLWPEFARVVGLVRPRYVFVENPPGLLRREFGDVLGDLASLGYDAEWESISASALGAPHERDRIWLVAYARSEQFSGGRRSEGDLFPEQWTPPWSVQFRGGRQHRSSSDGAAVPDSDSGRQLQPDAPERTVPEFDADRPAVPDTHGWGLEGSPELDSPEAQAAATWGSRWQHADGCSCAQGWCSEPHVGRVADGVPSRVDRIRCLGNAVVPQVAEVIGCLITAHNRRAA